MATISPPDEELKLAITSIRAAQPSLGIPKLLAKLKGDHPEWAVSEKRFRKSLQADSDVIRDDATDGTTNHDQASELPATTGLDVTLDIAKIAPKVKVKMFNGGKGKGLVAREKVSKGELLWTEEPWIVTADSNLDCHLVSQEMCSQCFIVFSRPSPPLSVSCPHCPLAHFCNRLCLSKARNSASHHELLCPSQNPGCKELLIFINQHGSRSVEAVARIIAKWRGEREWVGEADAKRIENRIWKGMARVDQEKKESERKEWPMVGELRMKEWHRSHQLICLALNPTPSSPEHKDFQKALRRHAKSGRQLQPLTREEEKRWFSFDSYLELLGLVGVNQEDSGGLYALHAHLNHSCDPNIQVRNLPKGYVLQTPPTDLPPPQSQRGTNRLSLLARRTIHPGEELTISYVNIKYPRNDRRQALRESYGFWCNCVRCEKEKNMAEHVHGHDCDHEDGHHLDTGSHELNDEDGHIHGPGCQHGDVTGEDEHSTGQIKHNGRGSDGDHDHDHQHGPDYRHQSTQVE